MRLATFNLWSNYVLPHLRHSLFINMMRFYMFEYMQIKTQSVPDLSLRASVRLSAYRISILFNYGSDLIQIWRNDYLCFWARSFCFIPKYPFRLAINHWFYRSRLMGSISYFSLSSYFFAGCKNAPLTVSCHHLFKLFYKSNFYVISVLERSSRMKFLHIR